MKNYMLLILPRHLHPFFRAPSGTESSERGLPVGASKFPGSSTSKARSVPSRIGRVLVAMSTPTKEQIIHRAYEIWEKNNKPDGRDKEFYQSRTRVARPRQILSITTCKRWTSVQFVAPSNVITRHRSLTATHGPMLYRYLSRNWLAQLCSDPPPS
jgi:hypothetical protein